MAMPMQILQVTGQSRRSRELRTGWVELGKVTPSPVGVLVGTSPEAHAHPGSGASHRGWRRPSGHSLRGARFPGNQTRRLHTGPGPPTRWAPHPAPPHRSLAGGTHARLPQLRAAVQMQSVVSWCFWFPCFCKRQRKSVGRALPSPARGQPVCSAGTNGSARERNLQARGPKIRGVRPPGFPGGAI